VLFDNVRVVFSGARQPYWDDDCFNMSAAGAAWTVEIRDAGGRLLQRHRAQSSLWEGELALASGVYLVTVPEAGVTLRWLAR
jgi:hypothetical protein